MASPAPSGRAGGDSSAPLPGWMLGFGQRRGLLLPPGCGALRGPSGSPSPGALGPGGVCPCCRSRPGLWCSAPREHPQIMAFSFFLGFFFLLFWQQTYPSRCPGESTTGHRGLPPCQPLRTGVRAEVLRQGRDRGQEPDLCHPAQPNPLAGTSNLGYRTPCCPPRAIPWGIGAGPRAEQQRTGTAQCLCERVAAWDGAAGDGQGKNKNPPK